MAEDHDRTGRLARRTMQEGHRKGLRLSGKSELTAPTCFTTISRPLADKESPVCRNPATGDNPDAGVALPSIELRVEQTEMRTRRFHGRAAEPPAQRNRRREDRRRFISHYASRECERPSTLEIARSCPMAHPITSRGCDGELPHSEVESQRLSGE
jgi:hypothetical protein